MKYEGLSHICVYKSALLNALTPEERGRILEALYSHYFIRGREDENGLDLSEQDKVVYVSVKERTEESAKKFIAVQERRKLS